MILLFDTIGVHYFMCKRPLKMTVLALFWGVAPNFTIGVGGSKWEGVSEYSRLFQLLIHTKAMFYSSSTARAYT